FAETEINVVNGFVAIALGFCLLGLVAWVDRRYLQRYEEVQAGREEAEARKVEQSESVPTDEVETVDDDQRITEPTPVAAATAADELQWKAAAKPVAPDKDPVEQVKVVTTAQSTPPTTPPAPEPEPAT